MANEIKLNGQRQVKKKLRNAWMIVYNNGGNDYEPAWWESNQDDPYNDSPVVHDTELEAVKQHCNEHIDSLSSKLFEMKDSDNVGDFQDFLRDLEPDDEVIAVETFTDGSICTKEGFLVYHPTRKNPRI